MIHSGYTKTRALWLNFLSALVAVLGLVVVLFLNQSEQMITLYFVPIAAGGFIYIAVADLIPELQKTKEAKYSILQLIAVITGVLAMLALVWLE